MSQSTLAELRAMLEKTTSGTPLHGYQTPPRLFKRSSFTYLTPLSSASTAFSSPPTFKLHTIYKPVAIRLAQEEVLEVQIPE